MILAQTLITEAAAVAVAVAALCRLAPMHLLPHRDARTQRRVRYRLSWVTVYFAMLAGAGTALWEIWTGAPSWAALLLLIACACYLWFSRVTWRDGPPAHTRVDADPRPIAAPFGLAAGQESRPGPWPWPGEPDDD